MRILIGLLIIIGLAAGGMFFLGQKSKDGAPPGLSGGRLAPCPGTPNCVTSEADADADHSVDAFPASAWSAVPSTVAELGGKVVTNDGDYIAATFTSGVMGFVDDVEFRRTDDAVHVRSASRVGKSDFGVNRKRVEALREAFAQNAP